MTKKSLFFLVLVISVFATPLFAKSDDDNHSTTATPQEYNLYRSDGSEHSTCVAIDILRLATDREITTEPIVLEAEPASSSHIIYDSSIRVFHSVLHSPYSLKRLEGEEWEWLDFKLENKDKIDTSVITIPDVARCEQEGLTYPLDVTGPGEVVLDFSYTKIIPGHYQDWNWTWIPEESVTTIVHVPIIVRDVETTPAANSVNTISNDGPATKIQFNSSTSDTTSPSVNTSHRTWSQWWDHLDTATQLAILVGVIPALGTAVGCGFLFIGIACGILPEAIAVLPPTTPVLFPIIPVTYI